MTDELSFLAKHLVFISGHVAKKERLAFLAHMHEPLQQEIYIAQLLVLEKGQEWVDGGRYKWQGVSITALDDSGDSILGLGRDGEVVIWNSTGSNETKIEFEGKIIGPLKGIRRISDTTFAYGMRRQLFRRLEKGGWITWTRGFPKRKRQKPQGDRLDRIHAVIEGMGGIEAISGTSIDNMYAVGLKGEIWHNDGSGWSAVDSPTNLNLYDVTTMPSGNMFACGQGGVVLKGTGNQWEVLEFTGAERPDFYSIAWFDSRVYLADGQSLQVLEDDNISIVDFGAEEVVPSHQVHAKEGILLSVAGKEVFLSTDGTNWRSLL